MGHRFSERRRYQAGLETMERRDVPAVALAAASPAHILAAAVRADGSGASQPAPTPALGATGAAQLRHPSAHPFSFSIAPDPFKDRPLLNTSDLKVGDILFSTTSADESNLIRKLTNSAYSHAALYIGNGKIIDATSKGVTARELSALTGDATRVGVMRVNGITTAQAFKAYTTAHELVGKGYNYTALGLNAVRKLFDLTNPVSALKRFFLEGYKKGQLPAIGSGYFCSELVIHAYRQANVTVASSRGDSPGGMIDYAMDHSSRFQFVGRLPTGH
ncbi:hypothetical protein OJF2_73570 [Aquisphaera giovannonii]|uniref:Permuted papain-like amidase enzyme, YaeF/YiiX, C92 family n=1 Tax=Aquisphaera giovannonii TaxID=406548 RepID=A0A5B9WFK0_9BACT|nr:YiiX/YebB-like N1pC/P60 family cysteine hydrolase [Aquisphaera giovannonii]QEH38751.1 hypothetical protein OJF2_73570 [Aquisphaera giovannonii]